MKVKDFLKILVKLGFLVGNEGVAEDGDLQVWLSFANGASIDFDELLPLKEIADISFYTNSEGKTSIALYFAPEKRE